MQTVNVKDIKVKTGVTQSGPKAGDPWELIIIIGDDGSEFTTFDKKAKEVGIGGIIELEPVLKSGKVNFSKFSITKKGQAPAPEATSNGESPEKRKSIEQQKAAELAITAYVGLHKVDLPPDVANKVINAFEKALDWCIGNLDKPAAPEKAKPDKPKEASTKAAMESGNFENVGQLITACNQRYGMDRSAVLVAARDINPQVVEPKDITDFDILWAKICTEAYKGKADG